MIYALGVATTPGQFYGLVHAVLELNADSTELFLRVAGALDVVACVGLLIPITRQTCLVWATAWGITTAVARPVAGMSVAAAWYGADQFLHEAVLRAPHAALPLFLFFAWRSSEHRLSSNNHSEA